MGCWDSPIRSLGTVFSRGAAPGHERELCAHREPSKPFYSSSSSVPGAQEGRRAEHHPRSQHSPGQGRVRRREWPCLLWNSNCVTLGAFRHSWEPQHPPLEHGCASDIYYLPKTVSKTDTVLFFMDLSTERDCPKTSEQTSRRREIWWKQCWGGG